MRACACVEGVGLQCTHRAPNQSIDPTHQVIDEEEGVRAVHEAFKRGINFFDTSPFYGGTKSETVRASRFFPRRRRLNARRRQPPKSNHPSSYTHKTKTTTKKQGAWPRPRCAAARPGRRRH